MSNGNGITLFKREYSFRRLEELFRGSEQLLFDKGFLVFWWGWREFRWCWQKWRPRRETRYLHDRHTSPPDVSQQLSLSFKLWRTPRWLIAVSHRQNALQLLQPTTKDEGGFWRGQLRILSQVLWRGLDRQWDCGIFRITVAHCAVGRNGILHH